MKKLFCIALIVLISLTTVSAYAEEWVCPKCNSTATGNFCNNCGAARTTGSSNTVRKSSGTIIAKKGDKSDTVKMIQEVLAYLGYFNGKIDGQYGKALKSAVKKYQHDSYLEETGTVDSTTYDELKAVYDSMTQGKSSDLSLGSENPVNSGKEYALREGKYVVGEDIAPGQYTLTCLETAGGQMKDAYGSLGSAMDYLGGDEGYGDLFNAYGSLFEALGGMTVEILAGYGDVLNSWTLKAGDNLSITLNEGTALSITDGNCKIVAR